MTHKKLFQFLTLSLFVALVLFAPLAAQTEEQKNAGCEKAKAAGCEKMKTEACKNMGEGCMMLKQIPNLSDEQKGKLEKLHAEHQAMMTAAMAEMQKKCQAHHEAVRALLSDDQKAKLGKTGCCGMGCCMMHQGCKMGYGKMAGMGCCKAGMAHKGCCAKAGCPMKHGMKMDAKKCPMQKDDSKIKEEEKK